MPKGFPYIIGNELAERFSYYGMKAILSIFMTDYLLDASGQPDPMRPEETKVWFHLFVTANYFFPILGALLSDILWGKYRTIICLSVVYCAGHIALAMDETRLGLSLGLTLIAIGSGGIKPCVSAHLGDQFGAISSKQLLSRAYNLFYLSVNIGSIVSTILTPWLLRHYGPSVAFGVPGILMIIATFLFWFGRHKFITVPPVGFKKFWTEFKLPETQKSLLHITILYLFISVFWALNEQYGSSWVLQAKNPLMIKTFSLFGYSLEVYPDQLQVLNPFFVLVFVPLFSYALYPWLKSRFGVEALGKIGIGLFFTALSFLPIIYAESQIQAGHQVSMMWQVYAFALLMISEVMVYGTGLEYSYSQAPKSMKSFIMGMYLLSISLGNLVTALVNLFIQNPDGTSKLQGTAYFWLFFWLMLVTAILYIFISRKYLDRKQTHESNIIPNPGL